MIVVDTNILIYAVNRDSPDHDKAKEWLEGAISGTETVGLPWIVLLAFLRLTTRAGLFQKRTGRAGTAPKRARNSPDGRAGASPLCAVPQ
jgi:predicted nucleic acid-binding protein